MQEFILKNFIDVDLNALHDQKKQLTLFLLSNLLNKIVNDKKLNLSQNDLLEFFIDFNQYVRIKNRLIREKMTLIDFSTFVVANWNKFNANQLHAINAIVETIEKNENSWNQNQLFFLEKFENTKKKFVHNIVMIKLRAKNVIIFAMIFSNIAITFLKNDFIVHFKFKILLDSKNENICSIKKKSIALNLWRKSNWFFETKFLCNENEISWSSIVFFLTFAMLTRLFLLKKMWFVFVKTSNNVFLLFLKDFEISSLICVCKNCHFEMTSKFFFYYQFTFSEFFAHRKKIVKKSLFSRRIFWILTMRWISTKISISHRDIMNVYLKQIFCKNSLILSILIWVLFVLTINISTNELFSRWLISTFKKSTKSASINFVKTCISNTISIFL